MRNYRYLLFDLDGTLTDSAEGIINSVLYALEKFGIKENDREKLTAFVGPPLLDSFMKYYGVSAAEAQTLTTYYREYFSTKGWQENRVYEGIPEALAELQAQGKHLILATSKPEVYARKIMDLFDLAKYFDLICGASMDGTISKKADVIGLVLEKLSREYLPEMVMIGDREHDVLGAKAHGIPCVGVLYGYGSRTELGSAGAAALCEAVGDLPELFR